MIAASGDLSPAQIDLRGKSYAGMPDLMPDGLRFEQSQRLQRQEAGHKNRVEEHPAHQLPIQPPFQCQRGDSRGQTASISCQQTDRQPLQGHASGKQRLERKKRRQRLQKGEAELQEPVQTVEASAENL